MSRKPSLAGAWTGLVKRAATFQARILLTLVYWTVLPFFALPLRLLRDPLELEGDQAGRWTPTRRVDPWGQ